MSRYKRNDNVDGNVSESRRHTSTAYETNTPPRASQSADNELNGGKKKHWLRLTLKSLGITALAFLLSFILVAPFSASVSVLFSSPEKSEFVMSDLYAQVADGRPVRDLDQRIVIVDIGHSGRQEIAALLDLLSLCQPKAVGLDVNFALPGDDDTYLIESAGNLPNLVLPLMLTQNDDGRFAITDRTFLADSIKDVNFGAVNFVSKTERSSIREYPIEFKLEDGRSVGSFPVELAMLGDASKVKMLTDRGNSHEVINYPSREFKIIRIEDAEERAEEFTDKYVLIGAIGEASDMHPTPVNSYVSGIEIHAYSLSSILDSKWYLSLPPWADYLVAGLLCFMIVFGATAITNKFRGIILRMVQLILVYVAVWGGYTLYIDYGVICNFSYTILMLAFGLFAVDVWNGCEALVVIIKSKLTNRTAII